MSKRIKRQCSSAHFPKAFPYNNTSTLFWALSVASEAGRTGQAMFYEEIYCGFIVVGIVVTVGFLCLPYRKVLTVVAKQYEAQPGARAKL